jgi:hypothetical protein
VTLRRTRESVVRAVGIAGDRMPDGYVPACLFLRQFAMAPPMFNAMPNVELTGRQRQGALAARRMMNQKRLAAKVACCWRSGSALG